MEPVNNLFDVNALKAASASPVTPPAAATLESPAPAAPITPDAPTAPAASEKPIETPGKETSPSSGSPAAPAAPAATPAASVTDPVITTPATPAATPPANETDKAITDALARQQRELFERLGVASIEELEERAKPKVELTPEQKQQQIDLHRAKAENYAIEKLGYKKQDFDEVQRLTAIDDDTLVFNQFKKEWMAANASRPEFAGQNLEELAADRYRRFMHQAGDADDPIAQELMAMGRQALKMNADSLRAQASGKVNSAVTTYEDHLKEQQEIEQFGGVIKNIVAQALPKQMTYEIKQDGHAEPYTFNFEITGTKPEEIEKALNSDFNRQFYKDHPDKANDYFSAQVQNFLRIRHNDTAVQAAYISGMSKGMEMAKVGSSAPFTLTPEGTPVAAENKNDLSAADLAKIRKVSGGM